MRAPLPPAASRRRPGPRRPRQVAWDTASTRHALFEAAAREFAAHGFDGASVDRIAAAARLNKAMIYYHFRSKAQLYAEILHDMFSAVAARVRAVAASPASPDERVSRFVEAIAIEAEARPHFPAIWFREIADGGRHLDDATAREMSEIVRGLTAFIQDGVRSGAFHDVSPFLVHGGIVAPLLLFFASDPLRARLERAGIRGAAHIDRADVVAHIQTVALGVLRGGGAAPARRARRSSRST